MTQGPAAPGAAFRPGEARALAWLAGAFALLYFGLFNHDFSVDALRYATQVEQGGPLLHPNHLLPNVVFEALWTFVQSIGLGGVRAIWWMQGLNALLGVATCVLLARAFVPTAGVRGALALAALYGLAFAAWNFAEEPEVYVLPAACVAGSLALLLRAAVLDWPRIAALAALAILAVLFLQEYVFWYPALLLLVARCDLGPARRYKLATLALVVPLVCLAVYVALGAANGMLDDRAHVLGWFLGYAWDPAQGFGTYRPPLAWSARLLGLVCALGNLVFAYELLLKPWALALGALAMLCLGAVVVAALRGPAPDSRARAATSALLLWLVPTLVFATWWESRDIEFFLPVWLAFVALLGVNAQARPPRALLAAVALIGLANLSVAFWPQRDWPWRYRTALALVEREQLGSKDVLITEELNTIGWLRYFHGVEVQFLPGAVSSAMHASRTVEQARAALDAALAAGVRVYTTELDEYGRLRRIATRFALLGRSGFDGAIGRDIGTLYAGLRLRPTQVPGARRVLDVLPP